MKKSQIYSSGWLKAPDMLDAGQEAGIDLTISKIETATYDDGQEQRAISFKEIDKRLGLNSINWDEIASISGKNDDDEWIGVRINVYPRELDRPFNGKTHGVRIRPPAPQVARTSGATAAQIDAARKEAFAAMKVTASPDASNEDLKAQWLANLAKVFPGKRQIELTLADWGTLKRAIEGYAGEPDPAAAPQMEDDIPF